LVDTPDGFVRPVAAGNNPLQVTVALEPRDLRRQSLSLRAGQSTITEQFSLNLDRITTGDRE
jgi:hypothetical protein